ncbi:hypothetical protein K9N50_13190, partial [bacterium]|nr:hypothetical protein [bacterium]
MSLPPHIAAQKAVKKAYIYIADCCQRRVDLRRDTRFINYYPYKAYSYVSLEAAKLFAMSRKDVEYLSQMYLDHHFDLLGSGWTQVFHGIRCRGLEGYRYEMGGAVHADPEGQWLEGRVNNANLEESKRIWKVIFHNQCSGPPTPDSRLPSYTPIDWHLDFKSGYRWSEKTWCKDIKFGHKLGVDIKVPRELAR